MRIVVFGGTGDVGKIIVEKLVSKNRQVVVLTRQQKEATENIHYFSGNVLVYESVNSCINEGDCVIISLGFNNSALDTMSKGTKNIIDAMVKKNCLRLICLSSYGAGESWNYLPEEFRATVMNTPILKAAFHDHGLQEEFIKASKLDWTIVRPTEIVNEPETKAFTKNEATDHSAYKISKYDVAQFIIDELETKTFNMQVVMITS